MTSKRHEAPERVEYSDLELAINSLVTEFHEAADDGPTMNLTQFQTMISSQLPGFAETVEQEEGLGRVLEQMGVQSGQNISFENFWTLINKQAVELFGATHKEKNGALQDDGQTEGAQKQQKKSLNLRMKYGGPERKIN
ncbi:hypothetical protein D9C73_016883 [Collichthys lucidus]|uniref:S100/CaBP-9k-type calcium binding subdomain domain-containing protein n=1 Tax=Collichthys lucidus TaxID=240159 RepID=A0A4U5V4I7_COLLU|nr:hypothetical protein D9C73_016883 [Collichthys lucidus]